MRRGRKKDIFHSGKAETQNLEAANVKKWNSRLHSLSHISRLLKTSSIKKWEERSHLPPSLDFLPSLLIHRKVGRRDGRSNGANIQISPLFLFPPLISSSIIAVLSPSPFPQGERGKNLFTVIPLAQERRKGRESTRKIASFFTHDV